MTANHTQHQPENNQAREVKQAVEKEEQERQLTNTVIGNHVLRDLGKPVNLERVQVRRLWERHYRVNVLVGADIASAKVAHSYFLETDSDGNIVASTPQVAKLY